MKLFSDVKHWLQTKIYHAAINIKIERDEQRLNMLKNSFKHIGQGCVFLSNNFHVHGARNIEIGDNITIGRSFRLETFDSYEGINYIPKLKIGNNVTIEDYCHIGCIGSVEIGNNVLIASKVLISDHNHGEISKAEINVPPAKRRLTHKPIKIGNNVWIGDGVIILPGVTLGDNIIVGANAVVTHSFPENVVIAGCPAKILRTLL